MAKGKKQSVSEIEFIDPMEKVARLLGRIVIKDIPDQRDQVAILRGAGFQVSEIAALMSITENHVSVALYQNRKRSRKKAAQK